MSLEIGGLRVGDRQPLFVIAELGLNHGGSSNARSRWSTPRRPPARPRSSCRRSRPTNSWRSHCPAPAHVPAGSLRDFFKQFELDRAAHIEIATRARLHGLAFVATPFSTRGRRHARGHRRRRAQDRQRRPDIRRADCPRGTNRLPLIMSTGMSTLAETAHAVSVARAEGAASAGAAALRVRVSGARRQPESSRHSDACHVSSARPSVCPITRRDSFAVPIAVTLGASIYERHLMLPGDDGVDARGLEHARAACGNCRRRPPHAGRTWAMDAASACRRRRSI